MKRLIACIAILILFTTYLISCEKDDLCTGDTPTTPGLVVEFYQADNSQLRAIDVGYYIVGDDKIVDPAGTQSKITLPLKPDADSVEWYLQYTSTSAGGVKTVNVDRFKISYTRTLTYVSRACGYKTTYKLTTNAPETPNPEVNDGPTKDGKWIKETVILTTDINNENEVHLKINI